MTSESEAIQAILFAKKSPLTAQNISNITREIMEKPVAKKNFLNAKQISPEKVKSVCKVLEERGIVNSFSTGDNHTYYCLSCYNIIKGEFNTSDPNLTKVTLTIQTMLTNDKSSDARKRFLTKTVMQKPYLNDHSFTIMEFFKNSATLAT